MSSKGLGHKGNSIKRVVIVDDQNLFAQGLKGILESIDDVEVVGIVRDEIELIKILDSIHIDTIFLDLNLEPKKKNGLEILKEIRPKYLCLNIAVLTMYDEQIFLDKTKKLGANAFLSKDAPREELQKVIFQKRKIFFVSEKLRMKIQKLDGAKEDSFTKLALITNREKEIIKLIAAGKTAKDIGEVLFISPRTVDTHRKNLQRKLGLHKISDIVTFAYENGII